VFLVSRMVEARDRGMSTTESIRIGTATTGRLITAAALVLAVVAGAFVFSDLVMMKYLAFGLLIALLLDATIVRMFLVPAIMKLLGDDCWWAPKWMKRLQNKIGLGETTLPVERKRPDYAEAEPALVGAAAPAPVAPAPVAPASEAPTTKFAAVRKDDDRDIGSWLGELRSKRRPPAANPPAATPADSEDATTAIPTQSGPISSGPVSSGPISSEETRAIPVSRPDSGDTDVATEQLNARAKKSGGVSAQDLLRREGRL